MAMRLFSLSILVMVVIPSLSLFSEGHIHKSRFLPRRQRDVTLPKRIYHPDYKKTRTSTSTKPPTPPPTFKPATPEPSTHTTDSSSSAFPPSSSTVTESSTKGSSSPYTPSPTTTTTPDEPPRAIEDTKNNSSTKKKSSSEKDYAILAGCIALGLIIVATIICIAVFMRARRKQMKQDAELQSLTETVETLRSQASQVPDSAPPGNPVS